MTPHTVAKTALLLCSVFLTVSSAMTFNFVTLPTSYLPNYVYGTGAGDMYWTSGNWCGANTLCVYGVNLTTMQVQGTALLSIANHVNGLIGLPSGGFIANLDATFNLPAYYYGYDAYGNILWSATTDTWLWPTGNHQYTIIGDTAYFFNNNAQFCMLNVLTGLVNRSECIAASNVRIEGTVAAITVTDSQGVSTTTGYSLPSFAQLWSFPNTNGFLAQNEKYLLLTSGDIFEGNTEVLVYNSKTLQLVSTIDSMSGVYTSGVTPRINGDNALFVLDDYEVQAVYINLLTGATLYETLLGLWSLPPGSFLNGGQAFATITAPNGPIYGGNLVVTNLDTGAALINMTHIPYSINGAVFAFDDSVFVPNLMGYTEWNVMNGKLKDRYEMLPGCDGATAYMWNETLVYTGTGIVIQLTP